MSHPGNEPPMEEITQPNSALLAEWIGTLKLAETMITGRDNPVLDTLARQLIRMSTEMSEIVTDRGDAALLPKDDPKDYQGKKAIYIEGVTEPPYPIS